MNQLIIGKGEVGNGLLKVLKTEENSVHIRDIKEETRYNIDVLHICFPYSESFISGVKSYIKMYDPKLVIIHSTVKLGTTRKLGELCVHSPIHGKHPDLAGGIETFVKYIGGIKTEKVFLARKILRKSGINAKMVSSPEASEFSKIMCTSYYGWNILFMKEMIKECDKLGVPFKEVYSDWNFYYNQGYAKLNMDEFIRPILEPVEGKIGGHCVVNNTKLADNFITNIIKVKDEEY